MRIKEVIKEKGFTIEYVAKQLGKSKSGMSQIVNNDNTPPKTLRAIASVINCSIEEFFYDESVIHKENELRPQVLVCPHCGKPLTIRVE